MKKIILICFIASALVSPIASMADQADDDYAQAAAIVRDIKENGPPELRRLPTSVIMNSALTFVIGGRTGSINPAQMNRMGGARRATENSLIGQFRALGN